MTMPELFIDPKTYYEGLVKTAAPTIEMPEDVGRWAVAIEQQLFKSHPYLGSYKVVVDMMDVDTDSRTAYGRLLVIASPTKPSGSLSGATPTEDIKGKTRIVQVPFIVKDGQLLPMDVFIYQGKAQPLTEHRISRALFRPDLGDALEKAKSLLDQIFPSTFNNGVWSSTMVRKFGSLLDLAAETGSAEDYRRFVDELRNDSSLRKLASADETLRSRLLKLDKLVGRKPVTIEEKVASLPLRIEPTTVMAYRDGAHYVVKMANVELFEPVEHRLSRKQALAKLGAKTVEKLDLGEVVTASSVTKAEKPQLSQPQPITEFGVYIVPTELGFVRGLVFPNPLNPKTGKKAPYSVFTTGTIHGMANQIFGWRPEEVVAPDLPKGQPDGFGMFVIPSASLDDTQPVLAIEPMIIVRSYLVHGVPYYTVHLMSGEPTEVVLSAEVKAPVWTHDALFLPITAQWVPLGKDVNLRQSVGFDHHTDTVEIRLAASSSRFNLIGEPVKDISPYHTTNLDEVEASFLLSLLGLPPRQAKDALDRARENGRYIVYGCRHIKRLEPKLTQIREKLAEIKQQIDEMKVSLLKEAAVIKDPESVDTLLSLNFINDENIKDFIDAIPKMEDVLSRLADLLIAVRIGLNDQVPEEAVRKAMTGLDTVIDRLQRLKYVTMSLKV